MDPMPWQLRFLLWSMRWAFAWWLHFLVAISFAALGSLGSRWSFPAVFGAVTFVLMGWMSLIIRRRMRDEYGEWSIGELKRRIEGHADHDHHIKE